MKLVILSDTHGYHDRLTDTLPAGDVLIHCGDVSRRSDEQSVIDFVRWFEQQPFDHKIYIAGNHDKYILANGLLIQSIFRQSICKTAGVR